MRTGLETLVSILETNKTSGMAVKREIEGCISPLRQQPWVLVDKTHLFKPFLNRLTGDDLWWLVTGISRLIQEVPDIADSLVRSCGSDLEQLKRLYPEWAVNSATKSLFDTISPSHVEDVGVLTQTTRIITTLRKRIVIVAGAGFSYDQLPITREFEPMLVQFLKNASVDDPVSFLHSKSEDEIWQIVEGDLDTFKKHVLGWLTGVHPAPQHDVMARLLRDHYASHLISLNWDNLFERAYHRLTGTTLAKTSVDGVTPPSPSLWKLHGDIEDLGGQWVLPHHSGRVFNSLIASLEEAARAGTIGGALIVGYSEPASETVVQERLIRWLDSNVPYVKRVRPDWPERNPGGATTTAKRFFQALNTFVDISLRA